jgi:hypothetical protein
MALKERKQLAFRTIQGLLHLPDKYSPDLVEKACREARKAGLFRYQAVAALCREFSHVKGEQLELIQEHEIIRNPKDYQSFIDN